MRHKQANSLRGCLSLFYGRRTCCVCASPPNSSKSGVAIPPRSHSSGHAHGPPMNFAG